MNNNSPLKDKRCKAKSVYVRRTCACLGDQGNDSLHNVSVGQRRPNTTHPPIQGNTSDRNLMASGATAKDHSVRESLDATALTQGSTVLRRSGFHRNEHIDTRITVTCLRRPPACHHTPIIFPTVPFVKDDMWRGPDRRRRPACKPGTHRQDTGGSDHSTPKNKNVSSPS